MYSLTHLIIYIDYIPTDKIITKWIVQLQLLLRLQIVNLQKIQKKQQHKWWKIGINE